MPTVYLARHGPATLVASYPFSPDVTAVLRDIPGRVFDGARKIWTFPLTPENVLQLHARLKNLNWGLSVPPDISAELRSTYDAVRDAAAIKTAGDSDIAFDYLTPPYAHQRAGLAMLARLGSGALLWQMRLGKTKTSIDYAEWLFRHPLLIGHPEGGSHAIGFRVLVIAPKTVCRTVWTQEIPTHAGHTDFHLLSDGSLAARAAAIAVSTHRYAIVNCEALSHKIMADALKAIEWDLVIVDESTRFKTPNAARTKALHRLRARRRVILTGTPITGKPEDAWSQFEFVTPGLFGKSYWAFAERYLHKDFFGNVDGLKPETADELKARIASRSYRILRRDVFEDLPPAYSDRVVTLAGDQAKAYAQMRDELRIEIDNTPRLTAANILTKLLRLTQVTAGLIGSEGQYRWIENGAKVTELDHLLNEDLADEQVVVFGLYQRELEELAARYTPGARVPVRSLRGPGVIIDGNVGKAINPGVQLPIIYGPTPEPMRAQLIAQFQAGTRRLLFVQPRTGGIGINLSVGTAGIYHTRGWSLEEYLQSQDRLVAVDQKVGPAIVHLVAEKTIDDDIAEALSDKQQLADHLTGDGARKLAAQVLGGK